LGEQAALVDDQHLVDGLGDLGEQVARDEDGASFGGEVLEEGTQPAHPGGVEPGWRARPG
jgi:hypothetical protein